jgi:hypothetical protein
MKVRLLFNAPDIRKSTALFEGSQASTVFHSLKSSFQQDQREVMVE